MTRLMESISEGRFVDIHAEGSRESPLHAVVIRLLGVAILMTSPRTGVGYQAGPAVPEGYRAWPALACESRSSGCRRRFHFYISPQSAGTTNDETFPSGTVMVVETSKQSDDCSGTNDRAGGRDGVHDTPDSIFVMEKCGSVDWQNESRRSHDVWAFATYDSTGRLLCQESAACGIRRVPCRSDGPAVS